MHWLHPMPSRFNLWYRVDTRGMNINLVVSKECLNDQIKTQAEKTVSI
jgi:hypothetical protein